MPNAYSSRYIVTILKKNGFVLTSQKGSHAKYRSIGKVPTLTVIVPMGREHVNVGTFKAIVEQSGLSEENFKR